MSWFVLTLICMLGWGLADLFYKKSNVDGDRYSHLKTAVWVGLMMGFVSLALTILSLLRNQGVAIPEALASETLFTPGSNFFDSAVKYLPASLGYIISMIIGYAGMRYLEVSIVSPVQNASGAFSAIAMFIYFSVTGAIGSFWEEFTVLQIVGTIFIIVGVIALGFVEQHLAKAEGALNLPKEERKYRYGALALLFPILYCIFDTIGTAADGIILDDKTGLGLGEIDVLILYGYTFFLAAVVAWIFVWIREKKPYNPFAKPEWKTRFPAAVFEQFGQIFYVYALADNPVVAAPMVASYCIVSAILSRIFLKEKLKPGQYVCIAAVIIGIVMMGVADGIEEYHASFTDPVVEVAEAAYDAHGSYAELDEEYQDIVSEDVFASMYVPAKGKVGIEDDALNINGDKATVTYTVTDEDDNERCFVAQVEKKDDALVIVGVSPVNE